MWRRPTIRFMISESQDLKHVYVYIAMFEEIGCYDRFVRQNNYDIIRTSEVIESLY